MTDSPRVALVTGANRGIGREVAQQLAASGLSVVHGMREVSPPPSTGSGPDELAVRLDVTDPYSVAAAVRQVDRRYGVLDVLVNNAGIAIDIGAPSEADTERLRRTYETNVIGVVTVTNAFLPLLRRSRDAILVNVSSSVGTFTFMDGDGPWAERQALAYQSSKVALNAVTLLYARELRVSGIAVHAVDPGLCATGLRDDLPAEMAQPASDGARRISRVALGSVRGPSGRLHGASEALPW